MNPQAVETVFSVVSNMVELIGHIIKIARSGKAETIEAILPGHFRTELARATAEARAVAKFGGV